MNKERIKATLDALKATKTFDMGSYSEVVCVKAGEENPTFSTPAENTWKGDDGSHYCKTAACIAGHAAFLANPDTFQHTFPDGLHTIAEYWLDLTRTEARDLFLVEGDTVPNGVSISSVTKDEAIQTLETLLETGDVDWSHADPKEYDYDDDYGDDD